MQRMANRNGGFTLVELLAASTLAVLLMTAVVSVLSMARTQSRAVDAIRGARPSTNRLAEQLRRDFLNASHIRVTSSGVRLYGTMAQHWDGHLPTGRLAEVAYEIDGGGETSLLVRRETHLDDLGSHGTREEAIWQGAARLEVRLMQRAAGESGDGNLQAVPGMSPMPPRLNVWLRDAEGRSLFRETIFHHWEDS